MVPPCLDAAKSMLRCLCRLFGENEQMARLLRGRMSESATDKRIRELARQLENEKRDHARTRNELQSEISRWQWLASPKVLELMGVYPPLRKLLAVLTEAAELQDPSRGAPSEDTIRTEVTELTPTERGVLSHAKHRHHVKLIGSELEHLRKDFDKRLGDKTHWLAKLIGGSEYSYGMPDRPVCWRKQTDSDGNVLWSCPKRGVKQPYSAMWTGCEGCGRAFEREEVRV